MAMPPSRSLTGRILSAMPRPTAGRLVAPLVLLCLVGCAPGQGTQGLQSEPVVLREQVQLVGSSAYGNFLAGLFAQSQFDHKAAASYFGRALEDDPDNLELLQRAYLALAAEGRFTEAVRAANRVLLFESDNAFASLVVAVGEAKEGDFAAVERRLTPFVGRRNSNNFITPLLVAWAQVGQNRIDRALITLAPMASNTNLAPLFDFHAALINDLAGRKGAAEQHYRDTVASNQLSLRAVQAAGAFLQRDGKTQAAQDLYRKYMSQHPDTSLLDPTEMLAAGAKLSRPVSGAKEGMAEALFGAGTSFRQGNALDAAMVFVRLALELAPEFSVARGTLGDILQAQSRIDEANSVFSGIKPDAPMYWASQLRIAGNLDAKDKVDESVALLRRLATERPERIDAVTAIGDLFSRRKRFSEAARAYEEAIGRVPQIEKRHWPLFYSRGIAHERSKNWARAEADFLKALELEPDQPLVLNYLGYSWVEQGINLDRAKAMIARAVDQRPNDGYIVDSLGWVLFRLGDFAGAVRQLERAVELRPEDPTINDHFGDALWEVGRQDEARFQWSRALSLDPEPELAVQIKEKLRTRPVPTRTAINP
jgi:tetratricopeptide (TPR) repeat protein